MAPEATGVDPNAPHLPDRRGTLVLGWATVGLAVFFNVPYAMLAVMFDYPGVLREPAGEILDRFHRGGPELIAVWYAFVLAGVALIPLAIGLSVTTPRLRFRPALAITATVAGALAGLTQAMGLMRWVFVVPELARTAAGDDPLAREAAINALSLIHAYGGVAIGEHLGQLLTAMFAGALAWMQRSEGLRFTSWVGLITATLLAVGIGEGLMIALGGNGDLFSLATIAGFLGLTLWLIGTGAGLIRKA
jgi:hypothetical protein